MSLSLVRDSLLMWSHYGDQYTGAVVGFDSTHEFFAQPIDVEYRSLRPRRHIDSHLTGKPVSLAELCNARHICVSWNLMLGKNILWCARQNGHSVQAMLTMYGAWIEGSTQEDIAAIKRSIEAGLTAAEIRGAEAPSVPLNAVPGDTKCH